MFVTFLDSASASFWVFGLLLFVVTAAVLVKVFLEIGRPLLPAVPTLLWLLNAFWVKTRFLKDNYSFKIDLYVLYPALTLITLGVLGIYLVSVMRDLLTRLDERSVPEEEGAVLRLSRGIFSPQFLAENLLMLGMAGGVLLLLAILVGVLAKQLLLSLVGLILILLTVLVIAFLLRFIALKDHEGREKLTALTDKLTLYRELTDRLEPVLKEFDKVLTTKMEVLPREAGEVYQRARLFNAGLKERIAKVETLQAVGRIEEIEAALAVVDEPLILSADNTLASPNIPRFVEHANWESFVDEHCRLLGEMLAKELGQDLS
jgi:hypothetical protein